MSRDKEKQQSQPNQATTDSPSLGPSLSEVVVTNMQRQLDALHDDMQASDARISTIVADTQAQLDELRALIGKKPAPASAKPVLPLPEYKLAPWSNKHLAPVEQDGKLILHYNPRNGRGTHVTSPEYLSTGVMLSAPSGYAVMVAQCLPIGDGKHAYQNAVRYENGAGEVRPVSVLYSVPEGLREAHIPVGHPIATAWLVEV